MSPEVSRRVAQALSVVNPDVDTRIRLARAAQKAESFSELPKWAQDFVILSESEDGVS